MILFFIIKINCLYINHTNFYMFHVKVRFDTCAKKILLTRSVQFVLIEHFALGYLTLYL